MQDADYQLVPRQCCAVPAPVLIPTHSTQISPALQLSRRAGPGNSGLNTNSRNLQLCWMLARCNAKAFPPKQSREVFKMQISDSSATPIPAALRLFAADLQAVALSVIVSATSFAAHMSWSVLPMLKRDCRTIVAMSVAWEFQHML